MIMVFGKPRRMEDGLGGRQNERHKKTGLDDAQVRGSCSGCTCSYCSMSMIVRLQESVLKK